MRLIYVCARFPWREGEEFFLPEIKELLHLQHQVLLVPRSSGGELSNSETAKLESISIAIPLVSSEILLTAFRVFLENPAKVLRSLGIVLRGMSVITIAKNLIVFPKALWLSRLARKWGAIHIHSQWAATTATITMIASEVSGIPWSFTAHRGDIVQKNLIEEKASKAAFIRLISKASEELMVGIIGDWHSAKIRRIHMGVEIRDGMFPRCPISNRSVIACPASLIPVKGHRHLLEAVHLLAVRGVGCTLHVMGTGDLQRELEEKCRLLKIEDRVVFHGHITQRDLFDMYEGGNIGIVVLPSVDLGNGLHEGIPVSLMEAMSYGIPVISTSTGGIPELLGEGAGILVSQKDPASIAEAIGRLIQDECYWREISEAGRKRIKERFDIRNIVRDIVSAMEGNGPPGPHGKMPTAHIKRRFDVEI